MHPVFMQALVDERVREAHRVAADGRRARLARQGRRETGAAPVAVLRSLRTTAHDHVPAWHTHRAA